MTEPLASFPVELAQELGINLLIALLIFFIGRLLAGWLTRIVRRILQRASVDATLERFLCNLLYAVLMVVVVIATINQLGVETTSLLAVLGAAGLAVGLALQGSLSNFAAGVLIVAFRPYKVGDFIEGGGVSGTVEDVQIFTTVLRSGDNKKIIVPNSQMMAGEIVNYSAKDTRRVDLVVGCGYDDDLDKVRAVLNEILAADQRVLKDPAPTVAVSELADSSVNFVVRPWVASADYWSVYFDLTEAIKKRFDQEGISIPYPQRDVHLYQHAAGS
ncbi:MAG: mechanosensitive ion channel family protein [Gammaproteobacteria bacterium]|nr:MAG: mechanosensitive ion channel family protein [Gammaproteobacteria bacterium]